MNISEAAFYFDSLILPPKCSAWYRAALSMQSLSSHWQLCCFLNKTSVESVKLGKTLELSVESESG